MVAERLRREFKLDLYQGAMQVAYREGVRQAVTSETTHAAVPGGPETIRVVLAIRPERGAPWAVDGEADGTREAAADGGDGGDGSASLRVGVSHGVREVLQRRELAAATEGLQGAAQYGELEGFPLHRVSAKLLSVVRPRGVSVEALRSACADALLAAVKEAEPVLLEPLMALELRAPERCAVVACCPCPWRAREGAGGYPVYHMLCTSRGTRGRGWSPHAFACTVAGTSVPS